MRTCKADWIQGTQSKARVYPGRCRTRPGPKFQTGTCTCPTTCPAWRLSVITWNRTRLSKRWLFDNIWHNKKHVTKTPLTTKTFNKHIVYWEILVRTYCMTLQCPDSRWGQELLQCTREELPLRLCTGEILPRSAKICQIDFHRFSYLFLQPRSKQNGGDCKQEP